MSASRSVLPRSACSMCGHQRFAALPSVWLELTPEIGRTQSCRCHAWMCMQCGHLDLFAADPRQIVDDHPAPRTFHDVSLASPDRPPYR